MDTAVEDGLEAVGDVGVVVESEYAVRFGERFRELLAVPLRHAADGDDGLGSAVILQIVGFQQGVDGVLLGGFDEAAGVDDGDVRVGGFLDELPAIRCQAACKLLRVHLVTGAAKRDKGDGTAFGHGLKTTLSGPPSWRAGLAGRPGGGGAHPGGLPTHLTAVLPCTAPGLDRCPPAPLGAGRGVSPLRGRPSCTRGARPGPA